MFSVWERNGGEDRRSPWEEQLKEGMDKLEVVKKEFMEESEKLILRKYGSHQQFKSTSLDLDRIKGYKSKYKAQITEAKDLLKKLSKDAEESNADPGWMIGAFVVPGRYWHGYLWAGWSMVEIESVRSEGATAESC